MCAGNQFFSTDAVKAIGRNGIAIRHDITGFFRPCFEKAAHLMQGFPVSLETGKVPELVRIHLYIV